MSHVTPQRQRLISRSCHAHVEVSDRGAVHFHAVIRIDGPDGGETPPPSWATAELLTDAIGAAASRVDSEREAVTLLAELLEDPLIG